MWPVVCSGAIKTHYEVDALILQLSLFLYISASASCCRYVLISDTKIPTDQVLVSENAQNNAP